MKEKFDEVEKSLFELYFEENPNCSKYRDDDAARGVFDILSKKSNILKMMEVSAFGKPALSVCVAEVENFWFACSSPHLDLNDDFARQAVGRMVMTILGKYGYKKTVQRDMPKSSGALLFKTAMCYEKPVDVDEVKFLTFDNTMAVSKGNEMLENWHLYYNITFTVPGDWYDTTKVKINDTEYDFVAKYDFRSQGNAHLIFWSESDYWFAMSFDGHKGDMVVNRNSIIDFLVYTLNERARLNDAKEYLPTPSVEDIYNILKNYEQLNNQ